MWNRILLDLADTFPAKCQQLIRRLIHNVCVKFIQKRKIITGKRLAEKVTFNVQNVEWDYESILALKYNRRKKFFKKFFVVWYILYIQAGTIFH